MSTSSIGDGFSAEVVAARKQLNEGRAAIRVKHDAGESGFAICRALSDLQDQIITQLYQQAASDFATVPTEKMAIVLLGGSGRQDIAPFSDADIMVLNGGIGDTTLAPFIKRFNNDLTDSGLHIGLSIRSPRDACTMAMQDACIFTSLTETRFLTGNADLFVDCVNRFRRLANKRIGQNTNNVIEARKKEQREYGETVYLLRPNVKRTRGGLRDIHLIRWLAYIRFGVTEIDELLKRGGISTADSKQLKASQEFLLRIRNEMHFHHNKPEDSLSRNEQVRLAEFLNYEATDGILAVESFMRDYFRYTSRLGYICDHFVQKSVVKSKGTAVRFFSPLANRQIDEKFVITANDIGILKSSRAHTQNDLEQVLRLMQLACLYSKSIEHETWISIRHAMLKFPDVEVTLEAARRFMALLSNTTGLDKLLRRLHEMQVLQKILPDFAHARGLLQFNEYHKYTVDEHSLLAVSNLVSFEEEDSILGQTYRQIREKNLLHLAMLLHDLGKGYPEDHSEVGRRIAEKTGKQFGLPKESTELIMFLVHKHLVMSHLAFHRDTNDPQMIAEFASEVGNAETLAMLFVLTCADIKAVGPGVLNPWKLGLLTQLYLTTRDVLTGRSQEQLDKVEYGSVHQSIQLLTDDSDEQEWLKQATTQMPVDYLKAHPSEDVAQLLLDIKRSGSSIFSQAKKIEGVDVCELVLSGPDRAGIFYRVCGALSSLNLQIVSADIKSLHDGIVLQWFRFQDKDFPKASIPARRLKEIQKKAAVAAGNEVGKPRFRKIWGTEETVAMKLSRPEIRVEINNTSVDTATIIDVFAYDKAGLLYAIAKKIFELKLDVNYACISTYAHQVIDVLYVVDENGHKIRSKDQLAEIQSAVLKATKDYLEPSN
jgi:[protein-PII] uridylyltransferase